MPEATSYTRLGRNQDTHSRRDTGRKDAGRKDAGRKEKGRKAIDARATKINAIIV